MDAPVGLNLKAHDARELAVLVVKHAEAQVVVQEVLGGFAILG